MLRQLQTKHPWLWAAVCFVVVSFPQWFSATWSLWSSEPFPVVLRRQRWSSAIPHVSAWWISVPSGLVLFGLIFWRSRKSRVRTSDMERSRTGALENPRDGKDPVHRSADSSRRTSDAVDPLAIKDPLIDRPTDIAYNWFVFHRRFGLRVLNTGNTTYRGLNVTVTGMRRWSERKKAFIESQETEISGGVRGMRLTHEPIDLIPEEPRLVEFAEYTSSGIDIQMEGFRRVAIVRQGCVWQVSFLFSAPFGRWMSDMCFSWEPGPVHPCSCQEPFHTGDEFGGYDQYDESGVEKPKKKMIFVDADTPERS